MQKIFINDNPLFFVDTLNNVDVEKNIHVFTYKQKNYVEDFIKYLETRPASENDYFYFYREDIEDVQKYFDSLYKHIEAAGGVVKNNKNEILFIERHGKWDLPKGKIEHGEKISDAAIREVQEECGIQNITIQKELPATYHTYIIDNQRILKKTYWFELFYFGNEELKPQTTEAITDARWMNNQETEAAMKNTYNSIRDVIKSINI